MNKAISVALLVAGVVLLIFGYNASQSFNSQMSHIFNGTPTNRSLWLTISGVVAAVAGLIGLLTRGPK
ncbi:MAG TPA: DUF3185 family protein [Verrucomicrobiae bacterium]|jgi:ABC-type uncharacterized transport system permease subunit|nr:DUF3185 family protein [Verrucomicrobiae bacterium]